MIFDQPPEILLNSMLPGGAFFADFFVMFWSDFVGFSMIFGVFVGVNFVCITMFCDFSWIKNK